MAQVSKSQRILIKLSGELLRGDQPFGLDKRALDHLALRLSALQKSGREIGVVMGGGNLFRGKQLQALQLDRTPADQIGMLATLMNGLALQSALRKLNCPTHVLSALECPKAVESYHWSSAQEYLKAKELLIFVGGTGNPYFTTDTAAALRGNEIGADILLKATKVDGIYDKDPLKHPDAKKYTQLTYTQYLAEQLQVMDPASVALCMSNNLPILVFNMQLLLDGKIDEILTNPKLGTLVTGA